MGFFGFLILLFVFSFIILPILKLVIRVFSATRRMKKEFASYNQQAREEYQRQSSYYNNQSQEKRKKFSKADGEYIQFEEIIEERTIIEEDYANYPNDRVSDVKYEDIKD